MNRDLELILLVSVVLIWLAVSGRLIALIDIIRNRQ